MFINVYKFALLKMYVVILMSFNFLHAQEAKVSISGKDSTVVRIKGVAKKGKIFKEKSDGFIVKYYSRGYSLNTQDICLVESTLIRKFGKKYKRFWRQYMGYYSSFGNKCVYVHLENRDNYKSKRDFLWAWHNILGPMNTEWNDLTTFDFVIIIETGEIYSFPSYSKVY